MTFTMLSPAIASGVANAALRWFESSSQCQKKIPRTEWTVLSSIILHTKGDSENSDVFRVLTAATGNKCLGRRDLNADGLVINDCHAEVLARRAFLRYLYAEVLQWEENALESSEKSIFKRQMTSHRLVLKPQYSLHLFISEAPCGDAAIYELRQEIVDELVLQRTVREDENDERSELRLTGAKRLRAEDTTKDHKTPLDKRFAQIVGIARVKSGRSDLPTEKQTLSMSCSDKLAKWNALGLQGSLLLQWFEPIYLNSIVVSQDESAMSVEKQQFALQRAVCTRLEERNAMENVTSCEPFVVSIIPSFSRQRSSNTVPSSLALNWTVKEIFWTFSSKSPIGANFEKFFNSFEFEFLMAATGFKQGAKKASKMDQIVMEKVASRLSKRNLLRAFHHVLSVKQSQNSLLGAVKDLNYLQLKFAVPFEASTFSTRSPSTAVTVSIDRRNQFFAAFNDWIGVPTTFKQFKL